MRASTRLRTVAALALLLVASSRAEAPGTPGRPDTVILLHGLWRSVGSMATLERALAERGFRTRNVGYPSTEAGIESLALHIADEVERCCTMPPARVHFVTHSLGGILVRAYLAKQRPPELGRVVMLAPPNHGSDLADPLHDSALFRLATGPVGPELGTGADSVPRRLGPVDFELGVIAGDQSWNPIGSWLLPGDDDGAVAVESARIEGMTDFQVVPESHTFIMRSPEVIALVIHFLDEGRFRPRPE